VAIFWDATLPATPWEARSRDAQVVRIQLYHLELRGPEEVTAAFETAAESANALYVTGSPLATAHRARIVELAALLRWPAMYVQRQYVVEGGLMGYEASQPEL
jgi:putative tryptophan/tyrosine transport system substrate-binding protein